MKRFLLLLAFMLTPIPALAQTHGIQLKWNASSGGAAATSYNIYRASGTCTTTGGANTCGWGKVGTTPAINTTYIDPSTGLAISATYSYYVTAVDATGSESVPSGVSTIQAPASWPSSGPNAPTGAVTLSIV